MGMDYVFSGSATYPRFDREFCQVAEVLGAKKSEKLQSRIDNEVEDSLQYWFGYLSSNLVSSENSNFLVPTNLPRSVVKWLDNPYMDRTAEETQEILEEVLKHPEIEIISPQIYNELMCCVQEGLGWSIS